MKNLNLELFAKDAITKNEMNYLKGGLSLRPEKGSDLLIPPSK